MDLLLSILSLIGFILLTASTGLFVAVEFALTGLERATIDQDLNRRPTWHYYHHSRHRLPRGTYPR